MGRRAGVSPEETRKAVLDAALETFATLGYHGASTRTIGSAADLTIGAVHHHFGSKGELYQACIEEADVRLNALIQQALKTFLEGGGLNAAVRHVVAEALRNESVALAFRIVARQVWEDPEGTIHARLDSHGGTLVQGAEMISKAQNIPLLQARIRIQAAVFCIARFALSPKDERMFLTAKKTAKSAIDALEEELTETLVHLVTG